MRTVLTAIAILAASALENLTTSNPDQMSQVFTPRRRRGNQTLD